MSLNSNITAALAINLMMCICADRAAAADPINHPILFPGLTLGATLYDRALDQGGFFLGTEVSGWYVFDVDDKLHTPAAAGAYVDAMWDFGSDSLRMNAGLGATWLYLGFEAGPLMQWRDDALGYGVSGRIFVSAAIPGLYLRAGRTWGDVDDTLVELGFTLKVPIITELLR